jgi:ABC-type Na+ transport system ATPase subunit NatA
MQHENLSDKLRRATEAFEAGDLAGTNALLREIIIDAKHHYDNMNDNRALVHQDIEAFLLQAKTKMAEVNIPIEERIEEVNELLNMQEFIDNRIEKLSTGQTQRASIARCIVHNPDIYIFDEPTLGLDIISSTAIIEFMKSEKERGKTVIYSTHYMEEAEYLCDRIIMLNKGRTITNDSPAELKRRTGAKDMRGAFYEIIKSEGISYEE